MQAVPRRAADDPVRAMGGTGVSGSRVGGLRAGIDGRVQAFPTRPLEAAWPYPWLDATHIKVREGGGMVSRAAMVAVAVNEDGKREGPGCTRATPRPEVFWTEILRSLADRGPRGVELVVTDDHEGLGAAARQVSDATHRRCRVHRMGNAPAHAPTGQRAAVPAMAKTVFAQETGADAAAQWDAIADALREKEPKLGAPMDGSRADVLASMDFPREHRPQSAGTNPLERVNSA